MSKNKDKKNHQANQDLNDSSDLMTELFTSEFLKSIKPFSPTIEIIGVIVKMTTPKKVHLRRSQKEATVSKIIISNNKTDKIQVNVWDEDITRINNINNLKIGSVIHIDGCLSKAIDSINIKYNDGTVPMELVIQSNTKVSILGELTVNQQAIHEEDNYPLVINLENCSEYLDKKIRLQAYIKTNFDIIKNQLSDTNSCCGSLVDKEWKIEARIMDFELPFINPFLKGQHVEVIGTVDSSYRCVTIHIQSIEDIKKIGDDVMGLSALIKANQDVIIKFGNSSLNKKFKNE